MSPAVVQTLGSWYHLLLCSSNRPSIRLSTMLGIITIIRIMMTVATIIIIRRTMTITITIISSTMSHDL